MSPRLGLSILVAGLVLMPAGGAAAARRDAKVRALARDHGAAASALHRARDLRAGRGVVTGRELTPALARLSARYAALDPGERREADRLLARPDDGPGDPQGDGYTVPEHAPFCTANFCMHWVTTTVDAPDLTDGDGDGAPDYVEAMAAEFEFVRARENGDLGWRAPVSDGARGGDGRLDVYLVDLTGTGILGYAATDPGQGGHERFAYMVMDEDYSDQAAPDEVLQVTAAHEYNHILQFAYDALQDSWFFEATAVWMEDVVHDDVDHYLGFMPSWATFDEIPLARNFRDKHYGSAVWNMWLDARHGPDLIRSAWEASSTTQPASFAPAAYDAALTGGGHDGFSASFGSFSAAVAEWRTASQFVEGAAYPDAQRRGNLQVAGAAVKPLLDHTTYAMYTVPQPGGGWPAVVRLDGELPAGVAGALALVGRTGADQQAGAVTTELQQLPAGGAGSIQLQNPAAFGRVTAVLVNADAEPTGFANGDWEFAADAQPFSAAAGASESTASAPANTALPTVSGVPRDGSTLTAANGGWSGSAPMAYARQWRRCDDDAPASCDDIPAATGATYTATEADVGQRLRVKVAATNTVSSAVAESAPTAAVVAIVPTNAAAPAIDDLTPVVGETLNASEGTWNGSRPLTITYQWRQCTTTALPSCSDIAGATDPAYEVADDDVDQFLRVRVTATNSAGSATRDSGVTQKVVAAPPPLPSNTALPGISGTATDGQTLTATDGTWTGSPTFARQWLRCTDTTLGSCGELAGATGTQYTLQAADVGRRLRVRVRGTNGAGSADAHSDPTSVVAALAPSPVTPPTIAGTARDGELLTATNGTWNGTAPTFTRRWQRCDQAGGGCADIVPGATDATYRLTPDDIGHKVRVVFRATNGAGSADSPSDATGVIEADPPAPVSAPAVTGSAVEGQQLTATNGTWSGTAPTFTHQWLRCADATVPSCADIAGETDPAYTLQAADVGKRIRVRVRAANDAGFASALSEPTGAVAARATAPANTVAPSITGIAAVGSELTSLMGSWTGTTPITITRQWQRCVGGGLSCADIAGAVGEKYTPTLADVLAQLRVVVRATNVAGTATASSALVGHVPAPADPGPGTGGTGGTGGGSPAPAGPSAPQTVAALAATFTAPSKAKLARVLTRGLSVSVGCSAACRIAARLVVTKALARKLKLAAVLARGTGRLGAKGTAKVSVRFTGKARKRLRKARRLAATMVVEVRDATGALASQRKLKITLRK